MQSMLRAAWVVATLTILGVACHKVPYTGRVQYNVIPDGIMRGIGTLTYAQMLAESRVTRQGEDVRVLRRVGQRISRVADQPRYDWEFTLINDGTPNAWCLPGGKIGFFTGILPALRNEAGMAFVMGHEVGHAVAHHGAERMSQQLTVLGGLAGLNLMIARRSEMTQEQRAIVLGALGVGAQFGIILPFSRHQESEADVIGMMYMASAGYPPAESIAVWDRMGQLSGGQEVPGFLSTHPTNARRQEVLNEWLPKARKRYDRNAIAEDPHETLWSGVGGGGTRNQPAPSTGGTPTGGRGR